MILHELRKVSGTNAKKQILGQLTDFMDKLMFQYAYDPDRTFGVKYGYIHWDNVRKANVYDFELLDKLANRELTGNGAREEIQKHCGQFGDLVKLICNKDLDCGITATTLNAVFGKGFIPIFEVQLAKEVPIEKLTLPMIGQIKYNGVRVLAHIRRDGVTFRTRNGHYFAFPTLAKQLHNGTKCYDKDIILDGELTYNDSKDTNHAAISGVVNSAIKGKPIRDVKDNIVFHVFDAMTINEFYNQECDCKYSLRVKFIENYITCIWGKLTTEETKHIQIAETFDFDSYEQIDKKFKELLEDGYEGLILKSWDHYYSFTRSTDWVKLKDTKSCDIKCIGIEEGQGKYSGQIGALVCQGEVEGRQVRVNVGSGLKDYQRSRTTYIGEIVEIKYNSVIRDKKTGEWSLFLPRFVTIRGDL